MIDFGLTTLDALQKNQEEGVDVPVYDPGTEKVLFTIRVHGPDSERQRRANERAAEEHEARGAATPLTREESTRAGNFYLARCCSAWSIENVPFSEDSAYELIKRYPWVKSVVDSAAANRLRFIKRSQTA